MFLTSIWPSVTVLMTNVIKFMGFEGDSKAYIIATSNLREGATSQRPKVRLSIWK
ncbi:hypothetical protein J14TS5_20670 [Paenibacillus lautus]|nr:hypothetical protein J14TS5_20670 [Paenibacillus lautus]